MDDVGIDDVGQLSSSGAISSEVTVQDFLLDLGVELHKFRVVDSGVEDNHGNDLSWVLGEGFEDWSIDDSNALESFLVVSDNFQNGGDEGFDGSDGSVEVSTFELSFEGHDSSQQAFSLGGELNKSIDIDGVSNTVTFNEGLEVLSEGFWVGEEALNVLLDGDLLFVGEWGWEEAFKVNSTDHDLEDVGEGLTNGSEVLLVNVDEEGGSLLGDIWEVEESIGSWLVSVTEGDGVVLQVSGRMVRRQLGLLARILERR